MECLACFSKYEARTCEDLSPGRSQLPNGISTSTSVSIQYIKTRLVDSCLNGGEAHLGPGVHHIHEVTAGVGPHDGLQHLLVLHAARAEAREGLATTTDGSLGEEAEGEKR